MYSLIISPKLVEIKIGQPTLKNKYTVATNKCSAWQNGAKREKIS